MTCRAIELLIEIRDQNNAIIGHLRNLDVLEEKKRNHRELMAKKRASEKSVMSQDFVMSQKEGEKGKETLSPTPPIREKGKSEEKEQEKEKTRAREISLPVDNPAIKLRANRIARVTDYNIAIGGNIDAEYFVDYYADNWPKNWQARLRNWLKENKSIGRIQPPETPPETPRTFTEKDWILCAERCANFMAGECKCRVGCITPPPCKINPIPPEECAFFAKSEGYEP